MKRVLFLLKERHYSHSRASYGLINSATHIAEFLQTHGHTCKVVEVFDGNSIDKEVYEFKADIVVLEALWCPVYKIKELMEIPRYRRIKWIVRVHSDIGYLSAESHAIKLLNEYADLHSHKLILSLNSKKFVEALSETLKYDFTYLPNIITIKEPIICDYRDERRHIDIGCFGAMRLLKNQCFQALAAVQAANILDKKLLFHITPNLGEQYDSVRMNLEEMFCKSEHELVIHDWLPNEAFQKLVTKMDLGLQISYTESFNIVSADFINNNRLVVVSDAIDWLPPIMRTSTTDYDEAARKIVYMYKHRNSEWLKNRARTNLLYYNELSKREWLHFIHEHHRH